MSGEYGICQGKSESTRSGEGSSTIRVLIKDIRGRRTLWKLIPARMCELLVGLGDVDLVGVSDLGEGVPLEVVIRSRRPRPMCKACGGQVCSEGYRSVVLVDMAAFGRPVRAGVAQSVAGHVRTPIVRPDPSSSKGPRLVRHGRSSTTSRAARWATVQVGRMGRPVGEVAEELGCGWHTVTGEVSRWV